MGKLRLGHICEAVFWLALAAFLYIESFDFDRGIEIYKFGATGWPRALLLLVAVAAMGQFLFQFVVGDKATSGTVGAASDDGAEEAARQSGHSHFRWYVSTFSLLILPFLYMRSHDLVGMFLELDKEGIHSVKLIAAPVLLVVYLLLARGNHVGAILTLPLFFAAMLEDLGFYSMAPLFIVGVTLLMGERRPQWIALTAALIMGVLLFTFVSLLYVGLPTGNISPFYDLSHWIVTMIQ